MSDTTMMIRIPKAGNKIKIRFKSAQSVSSVFHHINLLP